jgi:predicted MFS family arabinose efflux permease
LLVLATVQGSAWGWTSTTTISIYAIAVISLLAFYLIEQRSDSPIIQFKLFAHRIFLVSILANFSLAFFYTVLFFLLPLYLHNIRGQSPDQIGLTLLPATLMCAFLSPLVGRVLDKHGPKKVLLMGFSLFALSALLQLWFDASSNIGFIIATLILFGIGWSFILSPSIVAALSSVPEAVGGVAMGALGTLHNFGGAIGLAIGTVAYNFFAMKDLLENLAVQNIKQGAWTPAVVANPDTAVQILQSNTGITSAHAITLSQQFFVHGYHSAMGLLVVISLVAFLIVSFGLPKKKIESMPKPIDTLSVL